MNCEEVIERIQAYLDQSLPAAEADALADHLEQCGDCRQELDAYVAVERLLLDEPLRAVPPGFADRVMGRLAPQAPPRRVPRREYGWAAACAAAVLLAGAVVLLWPGGPEVLSGPIGRVTPFLAGVVAALAGSLRSAGSGVIEYPWLAPRTVMILGGGVLVAFGLAALRLIAEPRVRASRAETRQRNTHRGSLT